MQQQYRTELTLTVTSTYGHEHPRVVNDELWSKEALAPKS